MLKHIFFDLDHTLWDFETNSQIILSNLYVELDIEKILKQPFATFFNTFSAHNYKLWERYRKGFINQKTLRIKRFEKTFIDFGVHQPKLIATLSEQYLEQLPLQNKLMPFALDVLDYCQSKNYTLHIITNGFEKTQEQKILNSGIQNYFSTVICSEQAMALKPNIIIFTYAQAQACAQAHECIIIGDNLEVDVLGGLNAGWQAVYYNPSQILPSNIVKYKKTSYTEINCLSQLSSIL
jgi:putative hydrolase of the HAD superfamily